MSGIPVVISENGFGLPVRQVDSDLTAGSFTYGNSSAYAAIFFKVA
jgi:hypothetical protein